MYIYIYIYTSALLKCLPIFGYWFWSEPARAFLRKAHRAPARPPPPSSPFSKRTSAICTTGL